MAIQTHIDVASEVRALAAKERLTQAELGGILNLSRVAVSRRLNGGMPFAVAELITLSERFGVPVAAFFGERAAFTPRMVPVRVSTSPEVVEPRAGIFVRKGP